MGHLRNPRQALQGARVLFLLSKAEHVKTSALALSSPSCPASKARFQINVQTRDIILSLG